MVKTLASLFCFLLLSGFDLSEGARSRSISSIHHSGSWNKAKEELARADVEVIYNGNGVFKRGDVSFAMISTEMVLEGKGPSHIVSKSLKSQGDDRVMIRRSAPSPGAGH